MALIEKLTAIADAVRSKTGGTAKLTLDEMAATIEGIETGGGFPNGTEWTQSNITSGSFNCVYYSKGIWVAGGGNGAYYSTDAKIWVQSNCNVHVGSVFCANGLWVIATTNGLFYSTDGMAWTLSNATGSLSYIAYYDGTNWIGGGFNGMYYSTDGITWTKSSVSTSNGYLARAVSFHNVIIGYGSGIFYSTDNGKSFKTISNVGMYCGGVYTADGICILVTNTGIWYSEDGLTWTQSNITSVGISLIYYFKNLWIAFDSEGQEFYSYDGKIWQQINSSVVYPKVAFDANGICIVAKNENGIYYSIDGINWNISNLTGVGVGTSYGSWLYHGNGIWVLASQTGLYYSVTWEMS